MRNLIIFIFSILISNQIAISQGADDLNVDNKNEEKLVTVHAEDAYLPSILSILARESGYNIVTDPNVNRQEQLTIHLDDVPIQQAINLVVRAVGLSYEIVGNSFLIAEPKKLAEEVGITSHVIELKYADAMEIKNLLQDLSDKIQVDVSGNKLLINASPKRISEIEDAIKQFKDAGVKWPIWIMPVGATEESQNEDRVARMADETMDRGWNVAARVHCYIWGNQIGT